MRVYLVTAAIAPKQSGNQIAAEYGPVYMDKGQDV